MDEVQVTKSSIREEVRRKLTDLPPQTVGEKTGRIVERLFEFANFLESKIVLYYANGSGQVSTRDIIARSYALNKIVVLPAFNPHRHTMDLLKVDQPDRDLHPGPRGVLEPDRRRCKKVPVECIDIALIPGLAFDEKGGRIGSGKGFYDRFIPELAVTTRKVSIAFEDQIVPLIPMEPHDKFVDIIITEARTIYKI
jgi:5-formyltetrahydrofolate cyclo-ligase